jgi:thymidylate synthase (FAD)
MLIQGKRLGESRELRWVIEMRTHESAEEEIRVVFGKVAEIVVQRYPNFFGDFQVTMIDGLPKYTPENSKV